VTGDEARTRFVGARVARLATSDSSGQPHLVPIVFAVDGDRLFTAVDHKPKRGVALRRLANISGNPKVSVLVDEYDEDWSRLWWARADGLAAVLDPGSADSTLALDRLVERYPEYQRLRPGGPVVSIEVHRWSGWSFE
jgi:PPOX class probable F420-dependent enzyme